MTVLLIEDDSDKSNKISSLIKDNFACSKIVEKKSLRSGLEELITNNKSYDLILMDMSMPNFDISQLEPDGGSYENFAGRDLLLQMKLRDIEKPVLIITQYDTFGDKYNKLSLEELKKQLSDACEPNYKGTIYFNSAQENWKKDLLKNINTIVAQHD